MILKGPIRFDKQNLPSYVYKFNVALICFFVAWFIICVPIMVAVGYVNGENIATYVTMLSLFGVVSAGLLIYKLVALKLQKRLVDDCAAQLEGEFINMPLEEAEEILKQRGIISDDGFVLPKKDVFGKRIIPFEKAQCEVYPIASYQWKLYKEAINALPYKPDEKFYINVNVHVYDGDGDEETELYVNLDRALFNFLEKSNNIDCENIECLKKDKKHFCRLALGFNTKIKSN